MDSSDKEESPKLPKLPKVTKVPNILYKCSVCPKLFPNVDCALECCKDNRPVPAIINTQAEDSEHLKTHGGLRTRIWKTHEITTLIELVRERYDKLMSKEVRPFKIWREIRDELEKTKPNVTVDQIMNKWHNLKSHFIMYETMKGEPSKIRRPDYHFQLKKFVEVSTLQKQRYQQRNIKTGSIKVKSETDLMSSGEEEKISLPSTFRRRRLIPSLFGRRRKRIRADKGDKTIESLPSAESSPQRMESEPPDNTRILLEILDETRRHNQAMEDHNNLMRQVFSKIVKSMDEKTALLRVVVDRDDGLM